jgi:hypothetical protein
MDAYKETSCYLECVLNPGPLAYVAGCLLGLYLNVWDEMRKCVSFCYESIIRTHERNGATPFAKTSMGISPYRKIRL